MKELRERQVFRVEKDRPVDLHEQVGQLAGERKKLLLVGEGNEGRK